MSEFTDLMTMKLIEHRRLEHGNSNRWLKDQVFERMKLNKNINVRTSVDLIARIEVLAEWFSMSKAEMVTEMLESSCSEAVELITQDGKLDEYVNSVNKHLEQNYGFRFEYDESGVVTNVHFPEPKDDSK